MKAIRNFLLIIILIYLSKETPRCKLYDNSGNELTDQNCNVGQYYDCYEEVLRTKTKCHANCPFSQSTYLIKEVENNAKINYECFSSSQITCNTVEYMYSSGAGATPKCVSSCTLTSQVVDPLNRICYDTKCPDGYVNVPYENGGTYASTTKLGVCILGPGCPYGFHLLENTNLCFAKCDDAKTYDSTKYSSKTFYIDDETNACTETCNDPKFRTSDNRCVRKCEKEFYTKNTGSPVSYQCEDSCLNYYDYDTKECLSSCTSGGYLSIDNSKACKKGTNCPYGYYKDDVDNYCYIDCSKSTTKKFRKKLAKECTACASDSDGYRYATGIPNICYEGGSCPQDAPYRDNDKNKCYNTLDDSNLYKFHDEGSTIYKNSCAGSGTNKYYYKRVCYSTCPYPTENPSGGSDGDPCNCLYKFLKYTNNNELICLKEFDPCPSPYNFFVQDSKQCQSQSDATTANGSFACKILRVYTTDPVNYECISGTDCKPDEFYYSEGSTKYCLKKCPITKPYHTVTVTTGGYECKKKCLDTEFTDSINYLCYPNTCPGAGLNIPYDNIASLGSYKGSCITGSTCPPGFPYYINNTKTCVRDCFTDTKLNTFLRTSDNGIPSLLDLATNECTSKCEYATNKYKLGNQCVAKCTSPNELIETDGTEYVCTSTCTKSNYDFSTKVCANSCPSSAQLTNPPSNACYKICPEGFYDSGVSSTCVSSSSCPSGRDFYRNSDRKCVACTSSTDGYKIYGATLGECLAKCPQTHPYIIHGENDCYYKGQPKEEGKSSTVLIDGTYTYTDKTKCTGGTVHAPFKYFYNLGCYSQCPDNSQVDPSNPSSNSCVCKYIKIKIDNDVTLCLGPQEACPTTFPYFYNDTSTGLNCLKDCSTTGKTYLRKLATSPINYECTDCSASEFIYTDSSNNKFCVDKCPEDKPYQSKNNRKECTDSCGTDYWDEDNHICYDTCPGLNTREEIKIIDTTPKVIKKCIKGSECPSAFPYLYNRTNSEKLCLSSCEKTNTLLSPGVPTYLDVTKKECIEICQPPLYYDLQYKRCVDKCESHQYSFGYQCVEKCNDLKDSNTPYKVVTNTLKCAKPNCENYHYSTGDTECRESCPSGYYADGNEPLCVNTPCTSSANYPYVMDSTTQCVDCKNLYYFVSGSQKTCYNKCPSFAPYYRKETVSGVTRYQCYAQCPKKSTSEDCRYHFDGEYNCLVYTEIEAMNCSFIFNFVCYKDGCPGTTYLESNVTKQCKCPYRSYEYQNGAIDNFVLCLQENQPCPQTHKYYKITDLKCTDQHCGKSSTGWKVRKKMTTPINYECIQSCESQEYETIIKEDVKAGTTTTNEDVAYCVTQCPALAPYTSTNSSGIKECFSSCDSSKYYTDDINMICYDKCPGLSTIDEKNNKKGYCLDSTSCPPYSPYYFRDNYVCLKSCASSILSVLTNHTTTKLDETTMECNTTTTCMSPYYEDVRTSSCKDDCDVNEYKDISNRKCYETFSGCVGANQYYIEEIRQCVADCKSSKLYIIKDDASNKKCYGSCPTQYFKDEINYECVSTCPQLKIPPATTAAQTFPKISNKKCVYCTGPPNPDFVKDNEGYRVSNFCVDKCPDTAPYYIKSDYNCYTKEEADNKTNYYQIDDTFEYIAEASCKYLFNKICYLDRCPLNSQISQAPNCKCSFKWLTKNDGNNTIVCLSASENCPEDSPYFKADQECHNETFFYQTGHTNDCNLQRIISTIPVNYECITGTSCKFDEYKYSPSSPNFTNPELCVSQCPEDKPYHVYAGNKKCYANKTIAETDLSKTFFEDPVNKILYENYNECPGLRTYVEGTGGEPKKEQCLKQSTCPSDTPYLHDNTLSCVSNCSLTNNGKFSGGAKVTKQDNVNMKCVDNCGVGLFADTTVDPVTCVKECNSTQFISGSTCVNKCPDFYIYDTRKCVTSCPTDYFTVTSSSDAEYKKACLKSCPEKNLDNEELFEDIINHKCVNKTDCSAINDGKHYVRESNHKCGECRVPASLYSVSGLEGFITDETNRICEEKCNSTEKIYYNYQTNICKDTGLKKYQIENTNAFTDTCPIGYYLFNYICYKDKCPTNTIYDRNKKFCKCSYKFNITYENSTKPLYDCFSEEFSCPQTQEMFDDNLGCVHRCSDKTLLMDPSSLYSSGSYECYNGTTCPYLLYLNEIPDPENTTNTIKYCLKNCQAGYYFIYGHNECKQNCTASKYFIDEDNKICYENYQCTKGLKVLLNESTTTTSTDPLGNCLMKDQCPNSTFLYEENATSRFCIPDCDKTNEANYYKGIFTHQKTYIFNNVASNRKECVNKCSNTVNNKKTDVPNKECVTECGSSQFYYEAKKECYNNCSDIVVASGQTAPKYYVSETRYCVQNCNSPLYKIPSLNDLICYQTCPLYIDGSNGTTPLFIKNHDCVLCSNGTSGIDVGFYVPNDANRICYNKCPTVSPIKPRYNTDTNVCFGELCSEPYPYERMTNHECIVSCNGSTPYTFNFECYAQCDATKLLIKDSDNIHCKCKNKFYRQDTNVHNVIVCIDDNGNCPPEKPYLNNSNNECIKQCPVGTYTDDISKKCYETCPTTNPVRVIKESLRKCIASCDIPTLPGTLRENEGYKVGRICYDTCPDGQRFYNALSNECKTTDCVDTKVINGTTYKFFYRIENTYECISTCPEGYYQFNYICYKNNCPKNTNFNATQCECTYKFYKEKIGSKTYYTCLGENELCPESKKYFGESRECTSTPCGASKKIKQITSTIVNYQCLSECGDNEFVYKKSSTEFFCVDKCPEGFLYHKNGDKNCIEKCDTQFIDKVNHICYDICPGFATLDETKLPKLSGECFQETSCPIGTNYFYYGYSNLSLCISNCSSTLSKPLGSITTYKYISTDKQDLSKSKYECVQNCTLLPLKSLLNKDTNECVEKCGENGAGEFLYKDKCYQKCSDASNTLTFYYSDTKECTSSCKDGYYKETTFNVCFKSCPLLDKNGKELFTDNNYKICSLCEYSATSASGKGYYIKNAESPKYCYKQCPSTSPYHDDQHNICFSGSCLDSSNNPEPSMVYTKYIAPNGTKETVCYSSCDKIHTTWETNKNYRTENYECINSQECPDEYPYEYERICYKKGCPYSSMKMTNVSGKKMIRCSFSCKSGEYVAGDQCSSSCNKDQYPYQVKASSSIIGICLKANEQCSVAAYPYFEMITANIIDCSSQCSKNKIETNPETAKPYVSSNGTCVTTCPYDFPYLANKVCYKSGCPASYPFSYDNKPYECLSKCNTNDFIYGKNKCVTSCLTTDNTFSVVKTGFPRRCYDKCPETQPFFFKDKHECLTQCSYIENSKTVYSYYNPKTFECVKKCSEAPGYEFYINVTSTAPQVCLSSCPVDKPFYKEAVKECRKDCVTISNGETGFGFYSSENNNLCVASCNKEEKQLPNKICSKECTKNYPYQSTNAKSELTCEEKCGSTLKLVYSKNKCEQTCPTSDPYELSNICYSQCPSDYIFYSTETKKCLKTCDSDTKYKFHLEGKIECIQKCPDDQKYIIEGEKTCLTKCPDGYQYIYSNPTSGNIECTKKCPTAAKYISDNKCIVNCEGLKPFLLPENNTCFSSCPSGYPYWTAAQNEGKTNYVPRKCYDKCDKYISESNECIENCPKAARYIGKGQTCKTKCENSDGNYYQFNKTVNGYDIYTCKETCPAYRVYGDSECIGACPTTSPYLAPDNFCYSSCINNEKFPFTYVDTDGKKYCKSECDIKKPYITANKTCTSKCESPNNLINEKNECVQRCNDSLTYKFEEEGKCKITCEKYFRYSTMNYKCIAKCTGNDNYVRPGNICEKSCDQNSSFPFVNQLNGENICSLECPTDKQYYYKANKICQTDCNANDYVIQDTKECVSTCQGLTETPFFYEKDTKFLKNTCVRKCQGDKPFTMPGNKCEDKCDNDYKYYKEGDKICLPKCPDGFITDSSNKCINECPYTSFLYKGTCVSTCPPNAEAGNYKYYFESVRECLKSCGDGFYMDGNLCVDKCTYYVQNKTCTQTCKDPEPLFIKDLYISDINKQRFCLADCPLDYPYYTEDNSNKFEGCYKECPDNKKYHVTKPNQNRKLCQSQCSNNKPYIGDNNECLEKCPDDKPYYYPKDSSKTNQDLICIKACPANYPLHVENYYTCIQDDCTKTDAKILLYGKNICIKVCDPTKGRYKNSDGTICYEECKKEYGLFKTPDGQCLSQCPNDKNLMADEKTNNCICQNLYYINQTNGTTICLAPNLKNCSENPGEYKIQLENSKKCLNRCDTVISLEGTCLEPNVNCTGNSVKIIDSTSNQYRCECNYSYYRDIYYNKVCLAADQSCPFSYDYIDYSNHAKGECVKECPKDYYSFNNICYKACPSNTNKTNHTCTCLYNWFKNDKNQIECLDNKECTTEKPLAIGYYDNDIFKGTGECTDKCKGSYQIYYNKQCILACPKNYEKTNIKSNDPLKIYAELTCQCKNLWIIKDNEIKCSDVTVGKGCGEITNEEKKIRYLVKATNQCVEEKCPSLYPYKFNFECFANCENDAGSYYQNLVITKSSSECACVGPYNTQEKEIFAGTKITLNICVKGSSCEKGILQIDETKKCLNKTTTNCPEDYPYRFNNKCYALNKCPVNTHYDSINAKACTCDNLHYQVKNGDTGEDETFCMIKSAENCPNSHKYLVVERKECISNLENLTPPQPGVDIYQFNDLIYFRQCPIHTAEYNNGTVTKIKTCKCDNIHYWYSDDSNYNKLVCGYDKCPDIKPIIMNGTTECVYKCPADGKHLKYKSTCYEQSTCDKIGKNLILKTGNQYECVDKDLSAAQNISHLHEMATNDIVRYYNNGNPKGGYLYNAFGYSLQIVGYDGNTEQDKILIMRNNLSYIDFSSCLKSLSLAAGDKLILVKYDKISTPEHYLINPVEYEIYNKSGYKLDKSLCALNTIKISYPINYKISDYDNITSSGIKNSIRSLLDIGKKLNNENSKIDSFDHENELYHDHCSSCELEGKDLILRERGNYLYPNVSLCERGCKFESTDFKTERINCICPIKDDFNLNREHPIMYYNFSKSQIDDEQKGPSTLPTFTCFKRFTVKNNVVFGYCIVAFAAQIVLTTLSATIGYTSLISSISSKVSGAQNLNNNNLENIETENKNLASGPNASNPPPKDGDSDNNTTNRRQSELHFKEVIDIPNTKNKEGNYDYILNETTEFIPPAYCKMFFSFKDNGVVKEVKRSKIPFRVRKQTKYLYEPIPGATYKPTFYNPTSLKQNMVRIIEDIKETKEEEKKDMSPDSKGNNFIKKDDNRNVSGKKTIINNNNNNNNNNNTNYNKARNQSEANQTESNNKNAKSIEQKKNQQTSVPTNQQYNQNNQNKDTLRLNNNNMNNNYINKSSKSGKKRIQNTEKPIDSEDIDLNTKNNMDAKKYKSKGAKHNYGGDLDYDRESVADSQNSWKRKVLYENEDVLHLMKKEERLKDLPYVEAIRKDDINIFIMILTFISDKIYLIKTLIFLKKYEIFSAFFSLYILCHVLLFTLVTFFFDLDTISKIFNKNDYPNLGFYLLIGLYTNLIVWVVYRLLICLLKNNNRIVNLIGEYEAKNDNYDNLGNIISREKSKKLITYIKKKLIIFYIIQVILTIFCCLYLIVFSSVYTGTKSKIFKAYGIAILEILIVKIAYGIILAFLRKIALAAKSECFYNFVKFFDVHLS